MNQYKILVSGVIIFLFSTINIQTSGRVKPGNKIVAPKIPKALDEELQALSMLQKKVERYEPLSLVERNQLSELLSKEAIYLRIADFDRLHMALEPDVNALQISEMIGLSIYQPDFKKITELLQHPLYDLMLIDSNGQQRLDIVLRYPVYVYAKAIKTALMRKNYDLINEMAKRLVYDIAQRGEDVVEIVQRLRSEEIDELFIHKLYRLAHIRFNPNPIKIFEMVKTLRKNGENESFIKMAIKLAAQKKLKKSNK